MQLEIVTPDKSLFKGEVDYVFCPGSHGSFGILNSHAPLISTLKKGVVKVRVSEEGAVHFNDETGKLEHNSEVGKEISFNVGGGVVEVLNNKVVLLAE